MRNEGKHWSHFAIMIICRLIRR